MLSTERCGHTAVLRLDNPPANTWTSALLLGLRDELCALQADRDVYALVVSGAGERFFSAGADLKQFADGDPARADVLAMQFADAFGALAGFRGLSIAAINGYAMGGGLEWALACDLLVAEEHAVLGLPEVSVGLLPCGGGTQRLSMRVGAGWARRMVLCGERLDAHKALELGLVDLVVPRGQGLTAALDWAARAASQSPAALAAAKDLLAQAESGVPALCYARERGPFVSLFGSLDQREGVAAFLEKRRPHWKNQ